MITTELLVFCIAAVALSCNASGLQCASKKKYGSELRLAKLEVAFKVLLQDNARLKQSNLQVRAELAATKNVFKTCTTSMTRSKWSLKRINYVIPSLKKVQLHQKTVTYKETIPKSLLARNTKAVIVSVYCSFWNGGGHAYMTLAVNQKGNEAAGIAKVKNTHYKVYANDFYYEVMIPWDSKFGNEAVFKVTNTYNTGGSNNWYQVKLVGVINA
eukprot:gene10072-11101_t